MAFGLGVLGFPPDAFWSLTLKELDAAARGRLGVPLVPPSRSDLAALAGRYPDLPA